MKSDTDQSGTMRLAAQNKQKPGPGLHNEEGKWKRLLFRELLNDVALFISFDNAWTESLKRERSLSALPPGICKSRVWGFLSLWWVFFLCRCLLSRTMLCEPRTAHSAVPACGEAALCPHLLTAPARHSLPDLLKSWAARVLSSFQNLTLIDVPSRKLK